MRRHSELRENARNQVERKKALRATSIAVHREGDALEQEGQVRKMAALFELRGRDGRQLLEDFLVMSARVPTPGEHLIVEISRIVSIKQKRTQGLRRHARHRETIAVGCMARLSVRINDLDKEFV